MYANTSIIHKFKFISVNWNANKNTEIYISITTAVELLQNRLNVALNNKRYLFAKVQVLLFSIIINTQIHV